MRRPFSCSSCLHDGCCDVLPRCGGKYLEPGFSSCGICGFEFPVDRLSNINGELLCEKCAIIREQELIDEYENEGS